MSHPLLKRCLDEVSHAWNEVAAQVVLQDRRLALVRHPEIGAELVERAAAARDLDDVSLEAMVLEAVCEEARMDRDHGGAHGAAFLEALDQTIARLAGKKAITGAGTLLLGRCWFRAGLDVPPDLQRLGAAADEAVAEAESSAEFPDIDSVLDAMRKEAEGDPRALHQALGETTATFDPVTRERFVASVLARSDPFFDRLGCYWLLDRVPHVRKAAADAFLRRARAGTLEAETHARLLALRSWLPADAARDRLDEVLKEALRRRPASDGSSRPGRILRVLATIPDGTGAQSIAVATIRARKHMISMLLLAQGGGVKDAYVLPCRGTTGQNDVLSQITYEMDALEVSPAFLRPAIAAALANGIGSGFPPSHGLVDVAEECGLGELRPEPMPVGAWIAQVDPDGTLAGLSAQRRGRLIESSGEWPGAFGLMASWFESDAEVRRLLAEAGTERRRESALWRHLETRRQWWAGMIARTAATVKASRDSPADAWRSFAATALAVAGDRPLREVPIMRWVVEQSLAGNDLEADMLGFEAGEAWPDPGDQPGGPVTFDTPAPEKKGELKRRMKAAGLDSTPDWLDGYLAAVAVAPRMIMPNDWIAGALGDAYEFASQKALQRFLDLLVMRYNAANADAADPAVTGARITGGRAFGDWTRGFTASVERHSHAWSGRSVNKDDKRILKLIADAADGRAGAPELQALLPGWLARRRAARG